MALIPVEQAHSFFKPWEATEQLDAALRLADEHLLLSPQATHYAVDRPRVALVGVGLDVTMRGEHCTQLDLPSLDSPGAPDTRTSGEFLLHVASGTAGEPISERRLINYEPGKWKGTTSSEAPYPRLSVRIWENGFRRSLNSLPNDADMLAARNVAARLRTLDASGGWRIGSVMLNFVDTGAGGMDRWPRVTATATMFQRSPVQSMPPVETIDLSNGRGRLTVRRRTLYPTDDASYYSTRRAGAGSG